MYQNDKIARLLDVWLSNIGWRTWSQTKRHPCSDDSGRYEDPLQALALEVRGLIAKLIRRLEGARVAGSDLQQESSTLVRRAWDAVFGHSQQLRSAVHRLVSKFMIWCDCVKSDYFGHSLEKLDRQVTGNTFRPIQFHTIPQNPRPVYKTINWVWILAASWVDTAPRSVTKFRLSSEVIRLS